MAKVGPYRSVCRPALLQSPECMCHRQTLIWQHHFELARATVAFWAASLFRRSFATAQIRICLYPVYEAFTHCEYICFEAESQIVQVGMGRLAYWLPAWGHVVSNPNTSCASDIFSDSGVYPDFVTIVYRSTASLFAFWLHSA